MLTPTTYRIYHIFYLIAGLIISVSLATSIYKILDSEQSIYESRLRLLRLSRLRSLCGLMIHMDFNNHGKEKIK
jgi:hypothetical protein